MMRNLCLVLILFISGTAANAMQIVKDSKADAVIVIPTKACESVSYAAKELQSYLKKISGAELEITNTPPQNTDKVLIYVGYSDELKSKGFDLDGLGYDGFKIVSGDRWLALFGKDYTGSPMTGTNHPLRLSESYSEKFKINRMGETGTLYAVYFFLEKFCATRWYMQGELGEVLAPSQSIQVPDNIKISRTPDFEYRFLYSCDFKDDDDSVLWYRRAGFGAAFPVNINHSFYSVFKKYQKTNPEYFALLNGKRDFNISCMGHGNLCLSNPDVLKCFVKEAREFFDKDPNRYIFPIMPNDGLSKICECDECQKQINADGGNDGKFSNYVWKFVNDAAKEIYKTHPDKFMGCCAYSSYLSPPEKIEKLSPNVVVMICKTSANYWDPEYKGKIKGWVDSWSKKIKQGNLYCWEYYNWIGYTPYMRNIPVAFPHIIAKDLKFLKGKSKGEFLEAESWKSGERPRKADFPGLTHLNHYVTAKLMWDADTDVDQLLEEYYIRFYGPAASEMKKFWEKAEGLWNRNLPDRENQFYRKLYTAQEVAGLMSYLSEARARTADGSKEQKRIDLIISEIEPLQKRVNNAKLTEKPTYNCQYVSSAPTLDGNADDECWKNIVPVEFVSRTGEMVPYTSKMMACYDEKNLYLFFTNYAAGADTKGLKALCSERDSSTKPYIWEDESVEIFLNPTPGIEKNYCQFIINANGVVWDGRPKLSASAPATWNSKIETAVKTRSDSWTLELKIPFSDFGLQEKDLEKITMTGNFIRNRSEGNLISYSCWSPTMEASNHNTAQFGTITFKKKVHPAK